MYIVLAILLIVVYIIIIINKCKRVTDITNIITGIKYSQKKSAFHEYHLNQLYYLLYCLSLSTTAL